jgi:hypothetical protein
MAFNTKLNLTDAKVYQSDNEQLHLSGNTVVATVGDLRYQTHPNFTGATQVVDKEYVDLAMSGASGTTIYNLDSPAAVCVGGITVGWVLTGKSSNCILKDILVPELYPTLTAPSESIGLSPATAQYEVGCSISTLCVTGTFNRGSINPQYCSASPFRSGPANNYCFTGCGVAGSYACTTSPVTKCATSYVVTVGSQSWGVCTAYDAGVQPKGSKGTNSGSTLGAGTTSAASCSITGIYPYYYGKLTSGSRPAVTNALVTTGCIAKCVLDVGNPTTVTFNSASNEYTWFAIPATCTSRGCWYVNALDNGKMNTSPGDKYPDQCTISITSAESCWAAVNYKVYMSGTVGAIASPISFCI